MLEVQKALSLQPYVISSLAGIREEWELAADGRSLVEMEGNIGLFLYDLITAIGLTPEEKDQVLGAKLLGDVQKIVGISGLL